MINIDTFHNALMIKASGLKMEQILKENLPVIHHKAIVPPQEFRFKKDFNAMKVWIHHHLDKKDASMNENNL